MYKAVESDPTVQKVLRVVTEKRYNVVADPDHREWLGRRQTKSDLQPHRFDIVAELRFLRKTGRTISILHGSELRLPQNSMTPAALIGP